MSTNLSSVSSGGTTYMTSNKQPKLYDMSALAALGIGPNGLPVKLGQGLKCELKTDIKKQLRDSDIETAVNRYEWKNLPVGMNANLMERIIYYRGQIVLFKLNDRYFHLPYGLNGTPDVYGRWTSVTPLAWGGPNIKEGEKERVFVPGLIRNIIYDERDFVEGMKPEDCAVILQDRTPQYNTGSIISRQILNDPLLDVMAECIPLMRTSLIAGCGIKGMRVEDADQKSNVMSANSSILNAALNGELYVPITSPVELQEFTSGPLSKAEDYMSAFQSYDNYRLSIYGLDNGGVYQKKAHLLQTEQELNGGCTNLIIEDGLLKRKEAAQIFNKIFGENIEVEIRQTQSEMNVGIVEDKGGNDDVPTGSNDTTI